MGRSQTITLRRAELEHALLTHQREVSLELGELQLLEAEVPDATFDGNRWQSSAADRMTDVALEEIRASAEPRHDDPLDIYARAWFRCGQTKVLFTRDHAVATRVPGCLQETAGWLLAMQRERSRVPL